eukprot:GHVL01007424.1.p2 GENE.GHVL01007424.1~~GHVL01007424.1.p2  ORF type:complete len:319 (+),score=91.52 GHVL01007424.1:416-1372(+)
MGKKKNKKNDKIIGPFRPEPPSCGGPGMYDMLEKSTRPAHITPTYYHKYTPEGQEILKNLLGDVKPSPDSESDEDNPITVSRPPPPNPELLWMKNGLDLRLAQMRHTAVQLKSASLELNRQTAEKAKDEEYREIEALGDGEALHLMSIIRNQRKAIIDQERQMEETDVKKLTFQDEIRNMSETARRDYYTKLFTSRTGTEDENNIAKNQYLEIMEEIRSKGLPINHNRPNKLSIKGEYSDYSKSVPSDPFDRPSVYSKKLPTSQRKLKETTGGRIYLIYPMMFKYPPPLNPKMFKYPPPLQPYRLPRLKKKKIKNMIF